MKLLKLIKSYLQHRFFIVKHGGRVSGEYSANSGVPQGSNLGPLLFILFINDLPSVVKYSNSLLFADDLKIFRKVQTVHDCVALQKDLCSIHEWSIKNKLQFNIKKCFVMTISRLKESIIFEYCMDRNILERRNEIRDLGVTYNSTLSFSSHVTNLARSANRVLGFIIRQSSKFNNVHTIKLLYYSLVRPKLEFASILWFGEFQSTLMILEKTQNKLLRYLYYKKHKVWPHYETIRTTDLRNEFKIISLEHRRSIHASIFIYKIINSMIDAPEIVSLIPFNVPLRRTRTMLMFNVPLVFASTRSPLIFVLRLINYLNSIINLDFALSLSTFRNRIQNYYLNS